MPLSLSSIAIQEKNKLATDSVFLVALKIIIPGIVYTGTEFEQPVRIVNNSENITWQYSKTAEEISGNLWDGTWIAFPFTLDELSDQSGGEVPTVTIRISNVTRVMDSYLQFYDNYVKANGFYPITVNIYVVNTRVIYGDEYTIGDPDADPEVEHIFQLKKPSVDSMWATFVLSADNPYMRRFPQNRILKNHCRYKFKGSDGRCGYTGAVTVCNHTLVTCRALNNSIRFGGAPGVGKGGFKIY